MKRVYDPAKALEKDPEQVRLTRALTGGTNYLEIMLEMAVSTP